MSRVLSATVLDVGGGDSVIHSGNISSSIIMAATFWAGCSNLASSIVVKSVDGVQPAVHVTVRVQDGSTS